MDSTATLRAISLKESSRTIEPMAMVCTLMPMGTGTEGLGVMTSKKGKGQRSGPMAHYTREITRKARSMVGAHTSGLMGPHMKETGFRMSSPDSESTLGLISGSTLATGETAGCMVKGVSLGQMEESTKEHIIWTKSMDMAPSDGPMEVYIKDFSCKESNTARVSLSREMDRKLQAFGKVES